MDADKRLFGDAIFDPAFAFDGPHLVEASAGTGKTYNIQNVYARLVAEKGFRVSEIQVMTFTEAATKELRGRIRAILADFATVLSGGIPPAREAERLAKLRECAAAAAGGADPVATARARVLLALAEFDQAAISTIHGFCRRTLSRFAFETGSAFAAEFADTKSADIERLSRDWWRRNRSSVPPDFAEEVSADGLAKCAVALSGKTGWALDAADGEPRAADYTLARAAEIVRAYDDSRAARETLTFDDLLRGLHSALADPAKGPALAALLRNEFKAALVDEFQDTDPVQFGIFRKVFMDPAAHPAPPVFFVGDPKQAIYSFRGGDIYTYTSAARMPAVAAASYRLDRNFRSTPRLVDAVNALFMDDPDGRRTFGDESIAYPAPLRASAVEPFVLPGGAPDPAPFRIVETAGAGERVPATVQAVLDILAEQGANGITPKDIAVLTAAKNVAAEIRDGLRAAGVPAVLQRPGNVFAGRLAADLRNVLLAMARTGGRKQVLAAMYTVFFEFPGEAPGDSAIADMTWFFAGTGEVWQERGFHAAMSALEADPRCDLRRRLATHPDGERLLADYTQILDLAGAAIETTGPAPEALLAWLSERIANAFDEKGEAESEEYARLLESESDALKIMTIHVSKGLQFPAVVIPLSEPGLSKDAVAFHHDADGALHASPPGGEAAAQAAAERAAERMRLLYVAFTRAAKRTVLIAPEPDAGDPLAILFENARRNGAGPGDAGSPVAWTRFVPPETPPEPYAPRAGKPAEFLPARSPAEFSRLPVKGSYTSLAPGAHVADAPEADFDAGTGRPRAAQEAAGLMALPGGSKTGTCWHEIFERLPFDANRETVLAETRRALAVHGLAAQDAGLVADMVESTLDCPLRSPGGAEFTLREVPAADRLSEWEFNFSPAATVRTTAALAEILRNEWAGDAAKRPFLDAMEGWNRYIPEGCIRGFADLVFRKDGMFYIVDWKSNSLSRNAEDFRLEGITREMAAEGYFFQYLLYSAVLHRYLKETMGSAYSHARNFGGIRYFFLRGVPANGADAVFADRPGERLLDAFCEALGLEGKR